MPSRIFCFKNYIFKVNYVYTLFSRQILTVGHVCSRNGCAKNIVCTLLLPWVFILFTVTYVIHHTPVIELFLTISRYNIPCLWLSYYFVFNVVKQLTKIQRSLWCKTLRYSQRVCLLVLLMCFLSSQILI